MAEIIQAIEEDIMKTFQISDKIKAVSRIGIGCMRITGLPDEKASPGADRRSYGAWD